MKNSEDIHKLTEAVYKNLVENFNGGIRQVLLAGKAYHKALHSVSVTANAYNDALSRLGSAAKICRGGTDEIGEAILQISETQKELQSHIEESAKSLFTELLLPLEQKLEKEFKKANSDAKRYSHGHKVVLAPYNKAFESLKKFRKKTKNKYVYDNEKEAQLVRSLDKYHEKIEEYRIQSLKKALLEERRCYCFVLQRLCSISQGHFVKHRHGLDLYSCLPEWRDVCSSPHALPPAADRLIAEHYDGEYEPINGGPGFHDNSFLHRDAHSLRRSKSTQDVFRQSGGHLDGTRTLPHRPLANGGPPSQSQQVEALYSFTAAVENQLSFKLGDIITIMGENSDGWQFGQNVETQRQGWFPLSFTQPVRNSRASPEFRIRKYKKRSTIHGSTSSANPYLVISINSDTRSGQKVKSVGDLLDSRSLSEQHFYDERDVPGNIRRPRSLYEAPPGVRQSQTAPQAVRPGFPPLHPLHNPLPFNTQYRIPQPYTEPEQLYQPLPLPTDNIQLHSLYTGRDQSPQHASSIYSDYGSTVQDFHQGVTPIRASQPSPPLAPAPPPPPHQYPQSFALAITQSATSSVYAKARSQTLPAFENGVRRMTPPSTPAPPRPPPLPPMDSASGFSAFQPPKAPPPPPPSSDPVTHSPSTQTTSSTNTKQLTSVISSMSLLSQQNPKPSSGVWMPGFGSPIRQQSSAPPPPIPASKAARNNDDNSIEEDVNFKNNPMFSSVSLRKTKTNDRSAPKIK